MQTSFVPKHGIFRFAGFTSIKGIVILVGFALIVWRCGWGRGGAGGLTVCCEPSHGVRGAVRRQANGMVALTKCNRGSANPQAKNRECSHEFHQANRLQWHWI